MKRITRLFLTAAVVLFAGNAFAQDMTQAGELYQKATEAYQAGNEIEAVKGFKEALKIAQAAGDEGIEMAEGCKDMIPNILLSAAGKLVAAKDYAKAEETYNEALAAAKEYGKEAASPRYLCSRETTLIMPAIWMRLFLSSRRLLKETETTPRPIFFSVWLTTRQKKMPRQKFH